MRNLIFYLFLFPLLVLAQKREVFRIDGLPKEGILLNQGWKWHAGDNPDFGKVDYDDSKWEGIDPGSTIHDLPQIRKETIGWFRLKIHVDSSLLKKTLAFFVDQSIASEIYLDGKLIKKFGVVSENKAEIKAIRPINTPVGFQFEKPDQMLAVRFAVQPNLAYFSNSIHLITFRIGINEVLRVGQYNRIEADLPVSHGIYIGVFFVLTIIHLGFFLLQKKQKAYLFFAFATFLGAIGNILHMSANLSHDVSFKNHAASISAIGYGTLFDLFLLIAIYLLFAQPRKGYFWFVVGYSLISILFHEKNWFWGSVLPSLLVKLESLRISYLAYRKKFQDAGIILLGIVIFLIFYIFFILVAKGFIANRNIGWGDTFKLVDLTYHICVNGLPLALSIYFFRNFGFTSRVLEQKLVEVQVLSEEKQEILTAQNETLEKQVTERTAELRASQNQLIQSEKLASLGELTAGIAHEIQNPLNFVNNFAEISAEMLDDLKADLQAGKTTEAVEIADDLQVNLQKINHHGKRASAIVKGMLEHSRTGDAIHRVSTDLNALADEYLRLAYHGLRAKDSSFNATMETHFDPELPKIDVIPQDIGRVLLNLINNAFYAVAERSRSTVNEKTKLGLEGYQPIVIVSTRLRLRSVTENTIEISIQDNGNGIPDAIKDKIFQPFFTTKPTGQGTGLGLSLAYDIVTKGHGGKIEVESSSGEGTTFIIQLV